MTRLGSGNTGSESRENEPEVDHRVALSQQWGRHIQLSTLAFYSFIKSNALLSSSVADKGPFISALFFCQLAGHVGMFIYPPTRKYKTARTTALIPSM